jgi:ferredoxin
MRIRNARRLSQCFFFGLFLFLVAVADLRFFKGYPVSLLLELDPLVGIATAISAHELYKGLLWCVALLIPTLLLGRFFCNWICPYGALHQFTGWLLGRRDDKQRIEANRFKRSYQLKYMILVAMIVAAAFGSLQIGLLDPISLMHRTFAVALLPLASHFGVSGLYVEEHLHTGAWVIGVMLVALVGMNLIVPRFFCRVLCPLGALLGVASRFSLARIERDPQKCVDCDLCLKHCEGACDPHKQLRKSECFVCFNCLEDCPTGAISFKLLPPVKHELPNPPITGRRALLAGTLGVLFYGFGRGTGASSKNFDKSVIRPPGSVEEQEFLERCIKCDQCVRVCPTNVLQPAGMQAGIEGIWTPVLNMKLGYCELNCTLCGQACPTGAIQRIAIEEKLGLGKHAEQGPVRLGTAFYDRGRCLPWAMDTPCVVCEEVCPTSPKAIFSRTVNTTDRHGKPLQLKQPYVDPTLCIGCGICEHECPVKDYAAIRVTAIGETRSHERRLLLDGGVTGAAGNLVKRER